MPILPSFPEPDRAVVDRAADWLRHDGVVLLPTETFYGLAVDPRRAKAVTAVFDLKGRPEQLALPLVAASTVQVEACCGPLPADVRRLAERFWPGPLTLILVPTIDLARGVTATDGTVAVRVPAHAIPRRLAEAAGVPLTATSANRSGEPAASDLGSLTSFINDPRVLAIDAGVTAGGRPSTIVDARVRPVRLVRAGAVPWSRVLESLD